MKTNGPLPVQYGRSVVATKRRPAQRPPWKLYAGLRPILDEMCADWTTLQTIVEETRTARPDDTTGFAVVSGSSCLWVLERINKMTSASEQQIGMAVPLPISKVEAANRLHEHLDQWRLADQALRLLAIRCPGFEPDACLLKVVAVNGLYGTNLYATMRMAKHVAALLVGVDLAAEGPDLVERFADLPATEGQMRKRRHFSFASKFAHFFLDEERFPIMDSYALTSLKRHLGQRNYSDDTAHPYAAFVHNFQELKRRSGFTGRNRQLDRYLWLAGEYAAWKKNTAVAINAEAAALFAQPFGEVAALLDVLGT